jgi:tetratricopeptide (TPR) repeat protein
MYYPLDKSFWKVSTRRSAVFLLISLSLVIYPFPISAKNFEQSAEEYRLKGYEEQNKGNFELALSHYTKAVSLGLETAVIYNDLGVVNEYRGDLASAEENYRKALKLDPEYLPAYTNLAYLYKRQGRTDLAIQFFGERYARAKEGDPWKQKVYSELLQLDPQIQEKIVKREARQLRQELVNKAHEEFNLQLQRAERHYQEGQKYLAEKRFTDALTEYDRALSLTPENPKVIKAKAEAKYAMDLEHARQLAGQAVETLNAGEIEKARKEFQAVLATIPDISNK